MIYAEHSYRQQAGTTLVLVDVIFSVIDTHAMIEVAYDVYQNLVNQGGVALAAVSLFTAATILVYLLP